MHRLVGELLAVMPGEGEPWPRRARERWLAAVAAVLDVIYDDDQDSSPGAATGAPPRTSTEPARSPFVDGPRPGEPPTPRASAESESPGADVRYLDLRPEPLGSAPSRGRHARQPAD